MTGGAGAACAMHPARPGGSCSLRQGGGTLALLHLHRELAPRPAVAPRPGSVLLAGSTARLPERAFRLPPSPTASPETPPPRLLAVV
jgi:hypothetical protein